MHLLLRDLSRLARQLAMAALPVTLPAQPARGTAPDIRADIPAIERYIEHQMQRNRIPGVAIAIVSNDSVIYSRGFGTDGFGASVTERTGFVLGSMSKSFTALAVMQLVERNLVKLDAPVQRYLPWFRVADATASARITVRQLLLHTSGIPTNASRATGASRTLTDQVRALADVKLNHAPGAAHEYASPNYLVLGAIVEAVSQRSYASYIRASIFEPLEMRDSHVDQASARDRQNPGHLSSGHVYVFGFPVARALPYEGDRLPTAALISSAADMGRFLVAQMRTDSTELLSAAGLAQMHTGAAPSNGFSYAFGWRDGTIAGEHAVHHGGTVPNFRGKMVMLPDRHTGVVVLTNVSSAMPWPIAPTSHVMADEIAAALMGVPLPVPSDKHRWLFAAIAAAMLLVILNQLRGLLRILRGKNKGDRAPRARVSMFADLAFVAAVAFVIPRFAGLSWNELLSAAPDVAWWLIIAAAVSLVTAGARMWHRSGAVGLRRSALKRRCQ
ncbi:MAG: serine hydrolase domain-containing protein [Gemmatimonadaceae bacterium]